MSELLTFQERMLIEHLGQCSVMFGHITGQEAPRDGDLNEVVNLIHQLQTKVMAQAAARAYPDQFRLLGRLLPQDREGRQRQAVEELFNTHADVPDSEIVDRLIGSDG